MVDSYSPSSVCPSVCLSICHRSHVTLSKAMFRRRHMHSSECCHYFVFNRVVGDKLVKPMEIHEQGRRKISFFTPTLQTACNFLFTLMNLCTWFACDIRKVFTDFPTWGQKTKISYDLFQFTCRSSCVEAVRVFSRVDSHLVQSSLLPILLDKMSIGQYCSLINKYNTHSKNKKMNMVGIFFSIGK